VAILSPATQPHEEAVGDIPFYIQGKPTGLLTEKGTVSLPAQGVVCRRAMLLGLTNSIDYGGRGLAPTSQRSGRFFVGTQVGSVSIVYADGSRQSVPLIVGFNIWWYRLIDVDGFIRPFDEPRFKGVLEDAQHLTKTGLIPPQAFVMTLLIKEKPLDKIVLQDDLAKDGFPLVSGVTLEETEGKWLGLHTDGKPTVLAGKPLAKNKRRELQLHAIDPDTAAADAQRSVDKLQSIIGTTSNELDRIQHLPIEIPAGYDGPQVKFTGGLCANILTNMFYHNVQDMLDKTADGTYHTSTAGAPNWGRFFGVGTWKEGVGSYYSTAWSRDFGCSLIELAELGYQQRAQTLSQWAWKCADRYTEEGMKYPDGTPVPPHWSRRINVPLRDATGKPSADPQENDGHGLLMLGTFKTWQRCENRSAWAHEHWKQIDAAAEWICWQFEHPKLSGATEVLHTESEASGVSATSGGSGMSPMADFLCAQGLRAYAEIADSIGQSASANRWQRRADLMEQAMLKVYLRDDPKYGKIWNNAPTWGGHYAMLGPILALPDYQALDTSQVPAEWRDIDVNSFQWQLHEHVGQPWPFHAETMGYGQAWMSQAALIQDRMDEATQLVEWLARFTYYPHDKPYIVPEGVAWSDDAKYWHRLGDLGNGVQQAAAIKVTRLIIGVDDCRPDVLRILPRLPIGWTALHISNFPALTSDGPTRLKMDYQTQGPNQFRCDLEFTQQPTAWEIRLGPYELNTAADNLIVEVNGQPVQFTLEHIGDHQWIWLKGLKGHKTWTILSRKRETK